MLEWLEASWLASVVREGRWAYPVTETLHILGFVLLVGAAAMFDLRLLGYSSHRLRVSDLSRYLLPWSVGALFLVLPTGLLLFSTAAKTTWNNPAFQLKMVLLAAAAINAGIFRWRMKSRMGKWDLGSPAPLGAKLSAATSLVLWTGVICCGRFIAYL